MYLLTTYVTLAFYLNVAILISCIYIVYLVNYGLHGPYAMRGITSLNTQ